MSTQVCVDLPVTDLDRSVASYEAVGLRVDERVRDDAAAGVVVDEGVHVMLLTTALDERFTTRRVADAHETSQVVVAVSAESPAAVDALADRAVAAGAEPGTCAVEVPGMHGRAFADPDGHQWGVVHTDPDLFG
ncbi:VOC family protein [uncultured Pseudokineococcus sp.]|uniref:VOC family protein n=1 Tax=uncultured Pseudokineococcus sp. TaxID=1642928 RepID=UPI002605AF4A|nr:VOC family protein [uncultured Pseudokineococcus sp.]